MNNLSTIIKTCCPALGALVFLAFASSAQAVLIANWSFELTVPTLSDSANFGPLASDFGTGIARGHHSNSFTDWNSPTGNGSNHSWNSDSWGVGDYYQFQISTLALAGITIEWDQLRNAGSPADFVLQWSTDGTTFTDFADYSVLAADGTVSAPFWDPVTATTLYHFSYDLSSITQINNKAAIYLRLTSLDGASSVEDTVRVDNVNIGVSDQNGPIAPEPSTMALGSVAALTLAGLVAKRRRQG